MTRQLLAIGGSKHGQWLPDIGDYIYVPIPRDLSKFVFQEPLDLDMVMDIDEDTYYRRKLANKDTVKQIYVLRSLSMNQALALLRDFLVDQFINMDDPDDSN